MRNLSCKRMAWLATLLCATALVLSACGGRGVSKDLITQGANIPASFDVTLIADKDNQFDYDGAPLTEEDLRSALRYRKEQNLPCATVLVKRGEFSPFGLGHQQPLSVIEDREKGRIHLSSSIPRKGHPA